MATSTRHATSDRGRRRAPQRRTPRTMDAGGAGAATPEPSALHAAVDVNRLSYLAAHGADPPRADPRLRRRRRARRAAAASRTPASHAPSCASCAPQVRGHGESARRQRLRRRAAGLQPALRRDPPARRRARARHRRRAGGRALGRAPRRAARRALGRQRLQRRVDQRRRRSCSTSAGSTASRSTTGRATVGPGLRNFPLYRKLARRGLAVPSGSCPNIAIGGLATGGGMGLAGRGARPDARPRHRIRRRDRGRRARAGARRRDAVLGAARRRRQLRGRHGRAPAARSGCAARPGSSPRIPSTRATRCWPPGTTSRPARPRR